MKSHLFEHFKPPSWGKKWTNKNVNDVKPHQQNHISSTCWATCFSWYQGDVTRRAWRGSLFWGSVSALVGFSDPENGFQQREETILYNHFTGNTEEGMQKPLTLLQNRIKKKDEPFQRSRLCGAGESELINLFFFLSSLHFWLFCCAQIFLLPPLCLRVSHTFLSYTEHSPEMRAGVSGVPHRAFSWEMWLIHERRSIKSKQLGSCSHLKRKLPFKLFLNLKIHCIH